MPPEPSLPVPGDSDAFLELASVEVNVDVRASRANSLQAAKAKLSMHTAEQVNRMAYLDMRTSLYISGTLGFYIAAIVLSIVI